ncbi:type VII secretion-associated protein [Mycolicibacterium peregrinum]|uniref:type VII secretion-associated protein n=1 Tax=Mycolicibacterium peregrinum TaxID=43304 RepID=UPI0007E9C13C|nr:type VII secretion-associated protein [Mycolicibacterium peregrinum]OBF36448.1 type VII secretion-associated protein [Mycolicibacterium peregrinum]
MTSAVIEVGPVTVRGPGPVAADLAAVAVAGIDDEIALIEDEPVAVSDLWVEVLGAAGAGAGMLTLVCPTWWTADRCDRVRDAAMGSEVVVMQRVQALSTSLSTGYPVVVEIADEVVMVSGVHAGGIALARHALDDPDADAVVCAVLAIAGRSAEVVVDAPVEVSGAVTLGNEVVEGLRRRDMVATVADARTWRNTLVAPDTEADEQLGRRSRTGRFAMCAAAALAAVLGGIAVAAHGPPTDHPSMTVLVEGRVGVQIPAGWTVRRITEGPGSARVEVVSPSDPELMIHLTQSGVGDGTVADTLQAALREQPAGVFVDFDPSAVVAARQVVSYREVRTGREIRWAVFVDGVVRIAVGCQSAPGHGEAVRWACEAATRSAHAVF